MMLSSKFGQYLQCNNLAESSIELKGRAAKYFINLMGDIDVCSIRYAHIEDFRNWLSKGRRGSAANAYLKNFRSFFSWLVKQGNIERNPFDGLAYCPEEQVWREPYSGEDIEKIMLVCDTRWRAIILLGLLSLRRAEVLNLVCNDIHFDKERIVVSPKRETTTTWRWVIKNHCQAITPLPEKILLPNSEINLHILLAELIERLPPRQPYVVLKSHYYEKLMKLRSEGRLTHRLRGCPWGNFSRDFNAILKRANVKPRRFHDLRGTFATSMIRAGKDIKETQKLMRHSSPATTLRYYVFVDGEKLVRESNEICSKYYATCVP